MALLHATTLVAELGEFNRFKHPGQLMGYTGKRAGTEVAQLYLRALAASAGPRPVRELKGFHKIRLQPGESRDVSFTLSAKELGYYDLQGNWLVEPGEYQLWIAKDSASGEPAAFQLEK